MLIKLGGSGTWAANSALTGPWFKHRSSHRGAFICFGPALEPKSERRSSIWSAGRPDIYVCTPCPKSSLLPFSAPISAVQSRVRSASTAAAELIPDCERDFFQNSFIQSSHLNIKDCLRSHRSRLSAAKIARLTPVPGSRVQSRSLTARQSFSSAGE